MIAVEYEGRGMPAELRERVFDKFFRATTEGAASPGRPRGLGMGLAIAHGIVEAHGGRIWVESRTARLGSRVAFTVPIGDEEIDEEEDTMNQSQRILVVDDEPQIVRVLRRSLAARGYEVQVAIEGEEALEIFNAWSPDLIITDLSMPNMGGLELCLRVRAASQAPIIVLTAWGEERAKVETLDAGADDYVTKPFGMDELLARVRAALRRASGAADQHVKVLQAGDFLADLESRSVKVRGVETHLTPKEYELLVYLIRHPNKALTHRVLLSAVWGDDYIEQTEYLRVFIGQLRKKIEPDPAKPRYILTEPWVGYRFNTED